MSSRLAGEELPVPAAGTVGTAGEAGATSVTSAAVEDLPAGLRAAFRSGLAQAGPLAAAGLVANAANVVVTVLLARLLVARGYGALNQLTGVFLVVSMPGSAVIVAVVRRVTSWAGPELDVSAWARRLHRRGTAVLVAFAGLVVGAGPVLAHLLGRAGASGIDAMTVAGGVWVLLCLDRGLLQAHRDYRNLSVNLLAEGGLRTAAMLAFVGAGLGVTGAALGLLLAEVGTALHARVTADRDWTVGVRRFRSFARGWATAWRRDLLARDLGGGATSAWSRRDVTAALVSLAMIALLQNVDVLVIGRENPGAAGGYAAVSVSCKALVFAALVVGGYLLPEAAIRWREGGHALHQLVVTLLLLAVPGTALGAVAVGAPRLFLRAFFSARYVSAAGAFFPLALAMACLSCTVVLTLYLLAVGELRIALVLCAGAAIAVVAVASAHGAPRTTALADLCVQGALVTVIAAELVMVHRRGHPS